jgi:uncharacterized protein (TIGR02594 family)
MNFNSAILAAAGEYLGEKEWPGARHNPVIVGFFSASGAPNINDDETPWCAAFVGAVLAQIGLQGTGKLNARSYLDWGVEVHIRDVMPGDVVVFWRGQPNGWQGHVGFVVRIDGDRVIVRGGNQGNAVSDASYPLSQLLGFRRAVRQDDARRPILRHGSRGAMVLLAQDMLSRLGYHLGRADGIFGDRTREAVLAFQADNGLAVDGVIGGETWAEMDTAQPRARRDIDAAELRKRGSDTVKSADAAEVTIGLGAAVQAAQTVASAAADAEGALDTATRLVVAYWPSLLVLGALVAAWAVVRHIRAVRVRDAQIGAHIGR